MKITVVTVSYNSAKTVLDTLVSVASQTYNNVEHLLLDGASTDHTVDLIKSHSNPCLRLISEPDQGIYDAMNKGFVLATGDVVGFLNSDDFYSDESVLARVAQAFENPDIDACFADLVYVTQDKSRVLRYWKSKPFVKGYFSKGWCPAHPTFYVRKSVIDRLGGFDLTYKLAADAELMIRYLEWGQIRSVYIPHVLVHMRVGGATNQSWRNIDQQNREIFAALRKNGVPYSPLMFWMHKLVSRVWQRVAGWMVR